MTDFARDSYGQFVETALFTNAGGSGQSTTAKTVLTVNPPGGTLAGVSRNAGHTMRDDTKWEPSTRSLELNSPRVNAWSRWIVQVHTSDPGSGGQVLVFRVKRGATVSGIATSPSIALGAVDNDFSAIIDNPLGAIAQPFGPGSPALSDEFEMQLWLSGTPQNDTQITVSILMTSGPRGGGGSDIGDQLSGTFPGVFDR